MQQRNVGGSKMDKLEKAIEECNQELLNCKELIDFARFMDKYNAGYLSIAKLNCVSAKVPPEDRGAVKACLNCARIPVF